MTLLRLHHPQPDIAVLELAGDGRLNLMSYAMLRELWHAANELQMNRSVRAVVVTGTTDAFSAGMNLKQDEIRNFEQYSVEERLDIHASGARACAAWEALDAVTICAVEGYCIGGGLAFAAACDWRVASTSAQLEAPELRNGMNMSWQSIPRLVALIGPARTRRLVMRAERIDSAIALDWGLVDELAAPGEALSIALAAARGFLEMPVAPLRMSKRAINAAALPLGQAVSYMDVDQYVLCQSTNFHRDAVDQFFARGAMTNGAVDTRQQ